MFARSFCKREGFRRLLCSSLPSAGPLASPFGGSGSCCLIRRRVRQDQCRMEPAAGRVDGWWRRWLCDMDAVLRRRRGWPGLICYKLPICQQQAGSWHGDRHLHLFWCCCAPSQCFWEVEEQCWDTSASLLPLVLFVALSSCFPLQTSQCPPAVQHFCSLYQANSIADPNYLLLNPLSIPKTFCTSCQQPISASQIQPFSLSHLSTIHYLSSLGPRNLVLFRAGAKPISSLWKLPPDISAAESNLM